MERHDDLIFKIIPPKSYLVISLPLVFLSVFFTLLRSPEFTFKGTFLGALIILLLLFVVNFFYFYFETKSPIFKIDGKAVYISHQNEWKALPLNSIEFDTDMPFLKVRIDSVEKVINLRLEDFERLKRIVKL